MVPFSDLFSFCQRLDIHKVNRRVLEASVYSGAMDCFNLSRARVFSSIEKAIKSAEQRARNESVGQGDLFGGVAAVVTDTDTSYVHAEKLGRANTIKSRKKPRWVYLSAVTRCTPIEKR